LLVSYLGIFAALFLTEVRAAICRRVEPQHRVAALNETFGHGAQARRAA
jgi:hypothetical protein